MTARRGIALVVTGILLAALSLRAPIVAPTPVLREIEHDLAIGPATAGLLTTAPVLMFALMTPLAALVIRRAGAELALLASLAGVLVGTAIRAVPGFGWMLAGMIVIGAAITIGNVVIPVIIRRDVPPARVGLVTAAYVATLNAGSLITSLLTAPLAAVIGWPAALAVWAGLTVAGIAVWGAHLRRQRRRGIDTSGLYSGEAEPAVREMHAGADAEVPGDAATILTGPTPVVARRSRPLHRRPVVWLLVLAFSMQTTIYYGLTTWLPTLSGDILGLGVAEAGALASVFQGVAVAGAFLVPLLTRFTPRWFPTAAICAAWLVLTAGMLLAPQAMWVWLIVGSFAHSGGFVAIFSTLPAIARSDSEAAGISAFVQGGGYAVGALGAPVLGALHEATGGWTLALGLLVVLACVYAVALFGALAAARRASA